MLKPFFCYYGGKWRGAPRYPSPRHDIIVEPFAGAAGYATRYAERSVILIDADPVIAGLWDYLIKVSSTEVRRIPLLKHDQTVEDLGGVPSEAKHLVGFWLNKGAAQPCLRSSRWMRDNIRPNSYWGETIRERIAAQVDLIRHWRIIHGNYHSAPEVLGTWFVDPPYQRQGRHYRCGADNLNFDVLGQWCQGRRGQLIVCEQEGADWLPFDPFRTVKGTAGAKRQGNSREVVYLKNCLGVALDVRASESM
jgi:hypothetical protein